MAEYSQQDLNHTAGSANYRRDDVTARQASPLDGARLSVNGTIKKGGGLITRTDFWINGNDCKSSRL